jgi:hypothetical protein
LKWPISHDGERSDDYGASDDDHDDGASQEEMPFGEIVHEIHSFLALMRMCCYCGSFVNILIVDPQKICWTGFW